ncbi:MAG: hypothetical protein Unbinned6284contig1004_38 [Prokaryotic dsDNA virus sp.]|nr:MAG: hypothetical protein Unbinned6284contig1004_38 [Prokaryotic dsDNA virus sp.]|tara:strand:- start:4605 stop:5024 length:420 start_codon:yes stop_codon:yes gene_type:complete
MKDYFFNNYDYSLDKKTRKGFVCSHCGSKLKYALFNETHGADRIESVCNNCQLIEMGIKQEDFNRAEKMFFGNGKDYHELSSMDIENHNDIADRDNNYYNKYNKMLEVKDFNLIRAFGYQINKWHYLLKHIEKMDNKER